MAVYGSLGRKVSRLVMAISFLTPMVVGSRAEAATSPSIKWKVSYLRASTSVKTSSLVTTNSSGTKTWSVSGACTLSQGRVRVQLSGRCTVRLRVAARSPFTSRTSKKEFPIKTESIPPPTFDPYDGTLAGSSAIGTKAEATIETPDGRTRRFRTYFPASVMPGEKVPLIIGLHGGLGTSSQFEANTGLNDLAETNKFIAAYPDGIGNQPDGTGYQTWNGGYCCGPAATQDVDDVTFIRMVIEDMSNRFSIDPKKIFVIGHSNGGILAYKLACHLSDMIAAIGVQAGSNVVTDCQMSTPVSVVHLHGTSDTNMPIDGGKGSGVSATIFASARNAVESVAGLIESRVSSPKSMITSNPDVSALSWQGASPGTEVRFITVRGATHAWMGHPSQSPTAASYVGTPYPNLDATRAILSFLLGHPRK